MSLAADFDVLAPLPRKAVWDDSLEATRLLAEHHKEKIEAYWRERGYVVAVRLVYNPFAKEIRSGRYDVRSDMINGMPRGRNLNANLDSL